MVAIGIVSGGVNDVVSGCLPAVALTAAPAVTIVVTRAAVSSVVVLGVCSERKLDLRKILECCDDKSQHPKTFQSPRLQALLH